MLCRESSEKKEDMLLDAVVSKAFLRREHLVESWIIQRSTWKSSKGKLPGSRNSEGEGAEARIKGVSSTEGKDWVAGSWQRMPQSLQI